MGFSLFSYGTFGDETVRHQATSTESQEEGGGLLKKTKNEKMEALQSVDCEDAIVGNVGDIHVTSPGVKKIGTVQLAVIVFYTVSGGPFGIEGAVFAGGVSGALLGFLLMPLVWSIPEALVTAEMGAAFPEASGTVAWVEEAFGPLWGWLQGCLTWTSGATDNAIYPVLFLDYALPLITNDELDPWSRFAFLSCTCLILSYINYRGLAVVGDMSLTICVLSLSPFVIFVVVGMFQVDPRRWFEQSPIEFLQNVTIGIEDVDDALRDALEDLNAGSDSASTSTWFGMSASTILWAPFLNNLFWNLNSFDSASCFAGEVDTPGRSFPRAMLGSVILVVVGYFVPLLVATGVSSADRSEWVDGYMATVVSNSVGPWLGAWVILAAGISNLAMFQAELSSDAFQILGMAERGYLPKIFAKRSQFGTPICGIIVCTFVILLMSVSDLTSLIEFLNFNYALSLLLEYAAFLRLRYSQPDLHRPYQIPLGIVGCTLMLVMPVSMTVVIMMLASTATFAFAAGTIVLSLAIYQLRRRHLTDPIYNHVEEDEFDLEVAQTYDDETASTVLTAS